MNVDRAVMRFAGVVVLGSALLAHFVHPAWIYLTMFAGANLLQASFTNFCPAASMFRKMGAKAGSIFK